ncbi:MAG: TasA family protein [Eubacteriales bacterium]
MNRKKRTKYALMASFSSLCLSIAMLFGTTYAWFTDTASTAVNRIEAGTLDVALEIKDTNGNWVALDDDTDDTLDFVAVGGEDILWEPGCTYELPAVRIVNMGNLALKYKVIVSYASGDIELAEVLDVYMNGSSINATLKDVLTSTDPDGFAHGKLAANTNSGEIKIALQMKNPVEDKYQGLSIEGLRITVVAVQDTGEYDSTDNQYDADITYPEGNS